MAGSANRYYAPMRASGIVAATAVTWMLLLGAIARVAYHGDVRGFVWAGGDTPWIQPSALADAPRSGKLGYDGQFYATLATDPFLLHHATLDCMDIASYRAMRVGLPLLAWALALGEPKRALFAYIFSCWAFALLGVWVAAQWLEEEGSSPLWALPLALGAGVVFSLTRALPDAAAASVMMLGLWLRKNGRPGWTVALIFACLVRETSYLAAGAIAASEVRAGRIGLALRTATVPLLAVVAWQFWVASRPGVTWTAGLTNNLTLPGVGWWRAFAEGRSHPTEEVLAIGALFLGFAGSVHVRTLRSAEAFLFWAFAALAACLSYFVARDFCAYARVLVILPFLAIVLATGTKPFMQRFALRGMAIGLALSGVVYLLNVSLRHGLLSWPH